MMSLAGWAEVLFIVLLAFVVIGPKDLPKVLYMLGRFIQSLRRLSDEFMSEFESLHHLNEAEENKKKRKKEKVG